MRLIDADVIRLEYGGLMQIPYYDIRGIAEYFIEQIKQMPTIDPKQQWIPVSEKPIEKGLMLVTYNDGDVDLLRQPTAYRRSDIVAWMPCPEPYKEGKTDG